jgi:hypothetical protein
MPILKIHTQSDKPPFSPRSTRSSPSTSLFNFRISTDTDPEKQSHAHPIHAREGIPGTWRYIAANGYGPAGGNKVPAASAGGIWAKGMGGVVRRRSRVVVVVILLGLVYVWQLGAPLSARERHLCGPAAMCPRSKIVLPIKLTCGLEGGLAAQHLAD